MPLLLNSPKRKVQLSHCLESWNVKTAQRQARYFYFFDRLCLALLVLVGRCTVLTYACCCDYLYAMETNLIVLFLKQIAALTWNFTKFLCDSNGVPVKRFNPKENPLSFETAIQELLATPIVAPASAPAPAPAPATTHSGPDVA